MKKKLGEWYDTHKFTIQCTVIAIQLQGVIAYCLGAASTWSFWMNLGALVLNCCTIKQIWKTSGHKKLTFSPAINDSSVCFVIEQRYRSKKKQRVIHYDNKMIVLNLKDCSVSQDRFINAILYNLVEYKTTEGVAKRYSFTQLPEMDLKNKTDEQIIKKVSNLLAFL